MIKLSASHKLTLSSPFYQHFFFLSLLVFFNYIIFLEYFLYFFQIENNFYFKKLIVIVFPNPLRHTVTSQFPFQILFDLSSTKTPYSMCDPSCNIQGPELRQKLFSNAHNFNLSVTGRVFLSSSDYVLQDRSKWKNFRFFSSKQLRDRENRRFFFFAFALQKKIRHLEF